MKQILKLAENLNLQPLLDSLSKQLDLFHQITARQDTAGSYHQDTETIFFRWAANPSPLAAFTDIPAVEYPAIQRVPEVRALIEEVLRITQAEELGRVILVRFKPKGFIAPHIDEGSYADHYERFHLVISSEKGNHFMVENEDGEGEFVHMKPGCLYWFNHKKTHSVVNFSTEPRLHLIIDAKVPALRRERE